jgi:hypothetical protein
MENSKAAASRIQARDAATRLLNRLTAAVAFAAVAGVGVLATVSAHTIPGISSTSTSATTNSSTASNPTTTISTSSGLQSSSSPVSSSSGTPVVVTGGS